MNAITKQERAIGVFGVPARAFNVVTASDGRILNQTIKASRQIGKHERLVVNLRFDDECNNGHETFAITADLYDSRQKRDRGIVACGCLHDDIAKHFPEFARLIPWHLTSTDGPIHYLENTMYWLGFRGWTDGKPSSPPKLDYARKTAVWPDMPESMLAPKLGDTLGYKAAQRDKGAPVEAALMARLPALLERFKADMLAVGFDWPAAR